MTIRANLIANVFVALLLTLPAGVGLAVAASAGSVPEATQNQQPPSIFGLPAQPEAASLPPAGSPVLMRNMELRFPTQGNVPSVELNTYLYYMELKNHVSSPSQGRWVPYNEATEQVVLEDFQKLWDTGFLNDIWIEVVDEPWENGVEGKRVIFNLEERERVKIVTYEGSDELKTEEILENLQENGINLRLDSFIDPRVIRRVEAVVRAGFAGKGYQFAEVTHTIEEMPGGPKLVRLTFHMDEGPKVQVHEIEFIGNRAMSTGELKGKMEKIKERYWLSWITGRGTYKEAEFEEDADAIIAHYRNEGFIEAQVGQPEIEYLDESDDGETRGMHLTIPIDEGERFRLGTIAFEGNEVLTELGMGRIFEDLEPGDHYSEEDIREGFDRAREVYGALGYYEMTLFPDLQPRVEQSADANENGSGDGAFADEVLPARINGEPVVDVTIRVQEGEQYFINRIEFTGNRTTHDEVIRRELQLTENAVFNTEALKYSVRRLNQLGFFEPLEEGGIAVEEAEGSENEVDLTFDLTETNLNQLTFGAGVSQFDGFFGQVSFQTTNFMGRGESLQVSMQSGSRARNYVVSVTKPYVFGRPISLGTSVFSRRIQWIGSFTEDTTGGTVTAGWPLTLFTRMFVSYSYEAAKVSDVNPYFGDNPQLLAFNPFYQDALMMGSGGRRTIGKIIPTIRLNTVDHPIFPTEGRMLSASIDLAGVGGNTRFWKPTLETTWYIPHTAKTLIGVRAQYSHIASGNKDQIPIFERLWLGGEYSVRGFDLRRIGPTVADVNPPNTVQEGVDGSFVDLRNTYQGRTVMGGNKSFLLNAEYQFLIGGPVRLVTFYDVGQVQDFGSEFAVNDFKSSTGMELRFFMPMLNVPFRLIYYYNPQSGGIYNDRLDDQEKHGFRFAIGTTF